jgi:acyl-CoA synthetase (AMP-forming)/AMP-acid ligase II
MRCPATADVSLFALLPLIVWFSACRDWGAVVSKFALDAGKRLSTHSRVVRQRHSDTALGRTPACMHVLIALSLLHVVSYMQGCRSITLAASSNMLAQHQYLCALTTRWNSAIMCSAHTWCVSNMLNMLSTVRHQPPGTQIRPMPPTSCSCG